MRGRIEADEATIEEIKIRPSIHSGHEATDVQALFRGQNVY